MSTAERVIEMLDAGIDIPLGERVTLKAQIAKEFIDWWLYEWTREERIYYITALLCIDPSLVDMKNGYYVFRYNEQPIHDWVASLDTGLPRPRGIDTHHRREKAKWDNHPSNLIRMEHNTHFAIPHRWNEDSSLSEVI